MNQLLKFAQDLIILSFEQTNHEGRDCGEGFCDEICIRNRYIEMHNRAVLTIIEIANSMQIKINTNEEKNLDC